MKKLILLTIVSAAVTVRAVTSVNIAHFRTDITPPLGSNICGYAPEQHAAEIHDPIYACGLLIERSEEKALIVSFDLVGLDGTEIRDLRGRCAAILGCKASSVFFSCTHNHSGPESCRRLNLPDSIDQGYIKTFEKKLLDSVKGLAGAPRTECEVMFNSAQVDENYNRRFVTSDNYATFTPHRRVLIPGCDGPADKELGMVFFYHKNRRPIDRPGYDGPAYVIGNYGAHVLASHAPGLGGIRVTADFPGFYRDYLRKEMGCESMFIQGASGDLVPKGDELGLEAARRTGVNLAMATINAAIDCMRNPERFTLKEPLLRSKIVTFTSPMRSRFVGRIQPEYCGSDQMTLELQLLSIGDIAFAGMPGEALAEIGFGIKWNSPFRRTFIANLSTGFAGYLNHGNAFVQGGYEPKKQPFDSRGGLRLVNAAVDGLYALREEAFPSPADAVDRYPDNLDLPLVLIPGGMKATNFQFNEEKKGK